MTPDVFNQTMINRFRPHYPGFVDAPFRITEVGFNTIDDLVQFDFVKRFTEDTHFDCFRKSDDLLMAIYNDGYKWLVVGSIEAPNLLDLPEWDKGKYKIKNLFGIPTTVSGKDVAVTSGGVLWLKNGKIRERYRK